MTKTASTRTTRPPTLHEVAARTGVHISTVSRVLRQPEPPDGWSETAKLIRKTAAAMGYRPNLMAASLRTRRTMTIGVLMPRLTDYVMASMFDAMETAARDSGYQLLLTSPPDSMDAQIEGAQLLVNRLVDGMIISNIHRAPDAREDAIRRMSRPVVLINRHGDTDFPKIVCDDVGGGMLATRHLIGLGHRRIGCVAGPAFASTAYDRLLGYRRALEEAGLAVDPELIVHSGFEVDGGVAAGRQLLTLPDPPSAIFAINDTAAIGTMGVARQLGLSVPGDVSIIGYNDIPLAAQLTIPLTTIRSPSADMGRLGFARLIGLMNGQGGEDRILPVSLVQRQSTAPPTSR